MTSDQITISRTDLERLAYLAAYSELIQTPRPTELETWEEYTKRLQDDERLVTRLKRAAVLGIKCGECGDEFPGGEVGVSAAEEHMRIRHGVAIPRAPESEQEETSAPTEPLHMISEDNMRKLFFSGLMALCREDGMDQAEMWRLLEPFRLRIHAAQYKDLGAIALDFLRTLRMADKPT